jgi:serine/threonine-protein phosphatase 2A regulatory subunit B
MKVWDTHMTNEPVRIIPVQDNLQPYLADLFETENIFDKFEACFSPDGTRILTGSYRLQITHSIINNPL